MDKHTAERIARSLESIARSLVELTRVYQLPARPFVPPVERRPDMGPPTSIISPGNLTIERISQTPADWHQPAAPAEAPRIDCQTVEHHWPDMARTCPECGADYPIDRLSAMPIAVCANCNPLVGVV